MIAGIVRGAVRGAFVLALLAAGAAAAFAQAGSPLAQARPTLTQAGPTLAQAGPTRALAGPADAERSFSTPAANLSFERVDTDGWPVGWSLGGDAAVEAGAAPDGEHVLRLTADGEGGARATLRMRPPPLDGNRLRLSMLARGDRSAESLELYLRIDGPQGLLYVDRRRAPISVRADEWARLVLEAPVFDAAESIRLGASIDAGTVWIDALSIDAASTASLPEPSPAARRYVEYALGLIDAHSIYRAALDWPAFRAAVLEQARGATTAADAHLAVRYAIGRLGDVHGYLRGPERAAALGRAPVSNARTGRAPVPADGRRLPGGIGYVVVPGFAGGTHMQQVEFAEALQGLIRSLDSGPSGACGWIVDLRRNSGGNLWPMLLGIGPLLGDGDAVFATYPDGRRDRVWYRDGKAGLGEFARLRVRGEPYVLRGAEARVAILVGDDTASAGEVLAMAFRGLARRRSFGAPTDGLNSGTRTFVLADGAELVLAVVTMSDRTGRTYRGPMRPDVLVGLDARAERSDRSGGASSPSGRDGRPIGRGADAAPLADQPVVRAALDWLAGGC